MLYELFHALRDHIPGSNLLTYISFRAAAAALFAFLTALLLGPFVIGWLKRTGVGEQTSKTDSPTLAHLHAAKNNTPTMGGLFLVGAMLLSCILWMRFDGINRFSYWGILLLAWFATVGFIDDYIKLKIPNRSGLTRRQKQNALTIGALLVGILVMRHAGLESAAGGPRLHFPLLKDLSLSLAFWGGIPFLVVTVLVLTGAANAVNLTDGLDGLAIGCVIFASLAYAAITYFVGHEQLSSYLLVPHVPGCGELTVMLGAMLGASLGFLWYNAAPAQVFMGDVGSLALGGVLGYAALVSRTEIVLALVGGVFVAEALSVLLQVAFFKATGRRIFRCAPLHHHFQFAGMPETRLVVRIWVVSGLLALTSLALFKVR
jgi:phospho-N-acetylmuramoyl-pentapeptide-transferase